MNDVLHILWTTTLPYIADLAETVMVVMVPFLMWQFRKWMSSKTHSASFNCAMEKVTTALETAVLNVGHTYVRDVKATGSWGGEAGASAKLMALTQAKSMLGTRGLNEIKGCLGLKDDGLDELFQMQLETVLAKTKLGGLLGKSGDVPAVMPASASVATTIDKGSDPNATTVKLHAGSLDPADSGPVGPDDSKP